MAKKTTKKGSASAQAETFSVSTRFTDRERSLIERAAEQRNWTVAKLIREATLRRAADIINTSEGRELALSGLAAQVAKQLLEPDAFVIFEEYPDAPNSPTRELFIGQEWLVGRLQADNSYSNPVELLGYQAGQPSDRDLEQIKSAFESCSTEFARLVLEHWKKLKLGESGYRPAVNPEDLGDE